MNKALPERTVHLSMSLHALHTLLEAGWPPCESHLPRHCVKGERRQAHHWEAQINRKHRVLMASNAGQGKTLAIKLITLSRPCDTAKKRCTLKNRRSVGGTL